VEPLAAVNAQGRLLLARWLQGEAMRMQGELNQAAALLQAGLRQAEAYGLPLIAQRCLTSLGLLAETLGDNAQAESYFKQAVVAIEQARAPLPAEEFRTAFISDKLVPYRELLRLCLADGTPQRVAEALQYVERSRSRALLDLVSGALPAMPNATDPFEAQLAQRIETLREELNWFYSQINRPDGDAAARGSAAMTALYEQVHEREATLLDLTRQLQQRLGVPPLWMETFDPATLQAELGPDTVLIEYFSLDGDWLAFVVTQSGIEVVRLSATEAEVDSIIRQFHFQLGALRYGQHRLRDHLSVLAERARHHLAALYTALLAPLSSRLTAQRLIIVPHRSLHYVPFHALWAESGFVFEQREVVYVPSATILRHCLRAPRRPVKKAALFGVSDELAPHVRTEVNLIAPLFPEAVSRLDAEATRAAVLAEAPQAQVVHIASHGRFRPDNPLFSALQLTDGWLTVREAYQLKLECELVTLSACETGLSALAPGDELLGLARGFFATGAPALVVSLWAVDDEATAQLMRHFYQGLLGGSGAAAALRAAQLSLMQTHPHPYFWAPFILLGRW
jgi:CHAT domain-containing protein